jgi:hypothetical protein
MAVSADDVLGYLTDRLGGRCHLYDQESDELVAMLHVDHADGLVYATVPDVYPYEVLGKFRVTVEEET